MRSIILTGITFLLIGFFLGRNIDIGNQTNNYERNNEKLLPSTEGRSTVIIEKDSFKPHVSNYPDGNSVNYLDAGEIGIDGGLEFTLIAWGEVADLPHYYEGIISAQEGGKFVWVKIKFKNNSKFSADIHCSFDMGSKLFDMDGRRFDHIKSMYKISGNTGCNENIQPGFASEEIIAFEIPEKFIPNYVVFWNPNEVVNNREDSFGANSAVRIKLAQKSKI